MRTPIRLLTVMLALSACSSATEPDPVDLVPAPPVTEHLLPSFENACGFGHNSGRECQRLTAEAAAAAIGTLELCLALKIPLCAAGALTTGVAIDRWSQGTDLYGHHDWSECGWCTDPIPPAGLPDLGNPGGSSLGNRAGR